MTSTGQYASQLARQQYLLALQQRYLQELAQRLRNLESQRSALQGVNEQDASPKKEDSPTNLRRERLRQQNAEKAFQSAEKAKMNGRLSSAQKNYSRVVLILGDTDPLGRRAADALEELAQSRRNLRTGETRLASDSR